MRSCCRPVVLATALLLSAAVGGCATPPPASDPDAVAEYNETNDPAEPTNRVVYAVNDAIDTVLLRPAAIAYRTVVPAVVRNHTHNVLANLGSPVAMANDVLQAKPRRAGDTLMRFVVNSTIGVGGVFDVATDWGWPAHDTDGGITLGTWGVPPGPYLYLPVLGPSSPRDATGFGADIAMDPTTYLGKGDVVTNLGYVRFGLSALDARERVLDDLDRIKKTALDPYATIRSLSRQHRQGQIEDARSDTRKTVPAWFSQPAAQRTR
jgi:phospholipid-binding lipoprotein MlaA